MDSNNQIDATISQDALATFKIESEGLQAMDGPKKHRMKLLDFRLVFQYSTADVRLHVNRFRIDWSKGPLRYVPAKKLRKEKSLRSVLERARQKAVKPRKILKSNGTMSSVSRFNGSEAHNQHRSEEHQSSPGNVMSSQQLFSQVPTDEHSTPDRVSKTGRSLLRAPAELLQRLMPSSHPNLKNISRDSLPRQDHTVTFANEGSSRVTSGGGRVANNSQQPTPLAPVINGSRQGTSFSPDLRNGNDEYTNFESQTSVPVDVSSRQIPPGSASSNGDITDSLSSQNPPACFSDTTVHETNRIAEESLAIDHIASEPSHGVERPSSRKRQRESVEIQSQPACDDVARKESKGESPSKKRQRIDTVHATPKESSDTGKPTEGKLDMPHAEEQNLNGDPVPFRSSRPMRANPWEGLEMIPSSEVYISKDQAKLLEEKLWIPPMPNEQMPRGHVPPSLLRQWNNIVEIRHRRAEGAKAIPEQPPTPTQDTVMSSDHEDSGSEGTPIDWTPTPEQRRFENRLPSDSSPVRQPSFIGIKTAPSAGHHIARQTKGHDDSGDTTRLDNVSQPQTECAETSQSAPEVSAAEISRPVDCEDAHTDKFTAPIQASLKHGDADVDKSNLSQPLKSQASNLSQKPPTHFSGLKPAFGPDEGDSGDESDESMMDTSVPLGLGESWPDPTQSTQVEQDVTVTCSGSSLPGMEGNHFQVAETPATHNSRLRGSKLSKKETELSPSQKQLPSSQANKTSSPSRVLNTYPYHGSYEKSQSSNEGPSPSSHPSYDVSPRVDVEGTQTQNSSMSVPSQNATQSQEIVLNSSGSPHRHQNFSLSGQQVVAEHSSLFFTSSHEPASTQFTEQTQGSTEGCLSQDGPVGSSQVSPAGHFNPAVTYQGYTPLRNQKGLPRENEGFSQSSMNTQNTQSAALVARRLSHIKNPEKVAQAKEVYKRFCIDYSAYAGDFDHFIELCSKLQAVREGGQLQRSFLWDDFIIMHLQRHPSHIEERASQEMETLSYEEYFLLNVTHPIHRKRSLTVHGIELAASQFMPAELAPLVTSSQVQPDPPARDEATNSSLTTSLANNLSNLHAHSINEVAQSSLPGAGDPGFIASSRASSVSIKMEGPGEDYYNESAYIPTKSIDVDDSTGVKPALSSLESSLDQPPDITHHEVRNDADDISMGEVEETDLDDTHHETASVELGDESFISAAPAVSPSQADASPAASPDAESEDENWFFSLRHMRPKHPVWSDDPNTPFKRFVEAEQNVRFERLRRGGAKIRLNDKGVIRRPIHRD